VIYVVAKTDTASFVVQIDPSKNVIPDKQIRKDKFMHDECQMHFIILSYDALSRHQSSDIGYKVWALGHGPTQLFLPNSSYTRN